MLPDILTSQILCSLLDEPFATFAISFVPFGLPEHMALDFFASQESAAAAEIEAVAQWRVPEGHN